MTTETPARPGRIDTEGLRRKYREERDKRLRPDGNDQYLRLTGDLARYLDDPYTPRTERAPLTDHRTVVCILRCRLLFCRFAPLQLHRRADAAPVAANAKPSAAQRALN